jgi:hypothetical protein
MTNKMLNHAERVDGLVTPKTTSDKEDQLDDKGAMDNQL